MADLNVNAARPAKVRKSFVVTVNVDESRTMGDLKFISTSIGREAIRDALLNDPGEVFFEGQEDLAARWMALGNGALPLNLFMSARIDVTPAPAAEITQAREILKQMFERGDLDCLPTDAVYASLNRLKALLVRAEEALLISDDEDFC